MIALAWSLFPAVALAQEGHEDEATSSEAKVALTPEHDTVAVDLPPAPEPSSVQPIEEAPDRTPRATLSVELGTFGATDPGFDLFTSGSALPSYGGKLGIRVAEHVEVVGGWHRASRGARVLVPGPPSGLDFESNQREIASALTTDQLTLGPRVDVEILRVLLPYVTVQASLMHALARLDDDRFTDNNPNQLRASGMGVGFQAMGGGEVRMPIDSPVQLEVHLELGYGLISAIQLGDLGQVQPGGFVARGGAGIRF